MTANRCSLSVVGYCDPGTPTAVERHGLAPCTGHTVGACHLPAVARIADRLDSWPLSYACWRHVEEIADTRSQPVIGPLGAVETLLPMIVAHAYRRPHEHCQLCAALARDFPDLWRDARAEAARAAEVTS